MAEFADIHAHVIPGIDDGPGTLEEAVDLVRAAAGQGTRLQAATPHLHRSFPDVRPDEIAERLDRVRTAVVDEGGETVELVSGGEVSVGWAMEAAAEDLRLVSYGGRGTDLLIETPGHGFYGLDRFLAGIHARGYRVILAHPERSITATADFDRLAALAAVGVLLQVNAESLISSHRGLRNHARRLCRDGLASVIASDGHSGTGRRPITVLEEGVAALRSLVGDERATWMSWDVPAAVLRGEQVPDAPESRRRWRRSGR